jgi:hypothetical protein
MKRREICRRWRGTRAIAGPEVLMRIPLDMDDMEPTPPQTESTRERGYKDESDPRAFGRSEELGGHEAGDIADEGPGHRS